MRIDEPSLEWVLSETGTRWKFRSRPTTAYRVAAAVWCHGYSTEAAAAEVGVAKATAERYLRRLKARIRTHRALLDAGEPVVSVMDALLDETVPPPYREVRDHARHLLKCVRNRQQASDHPPVLSKNRFTGEWESQPLNAQVVTIEDAERIVSDLAWARGRGRC
jgi:hypothetical protein